MNMLSMRAPLARLTALAVLLLLASSCEGATTPAAPKKKDKGPPNVLVLLVDTLRPDHLGAYGYDRPTTPNLDAFAKSGFVFKNAYSTAAWTKPAVASLFTGLGVQSHRVVDPSSALSRKVPTMAGWFRAQGYETFYINGGNENVTPMFGLTEGFDSLMKTPHAALSDAVNQVFFQHLGKLKKERFFAVLHYMDAHLPYHPNPQRETFLEGKKPASPLGPPEKLVGTAVYAAMGEGGLADADRDYLTALYDGQVRHFDEELGRLLRAFAKAKLDDNTIIVVVSDHGEEFGEHGGFEHGHSLHNEVVRIPLIIGGPGIAPGTAGGLVSLADVAPTLLSLAGLQPPDSPIDGRSVAGLMRGEAGEAGRASLVMSGTLYGPERHGLLAEGHKLVVHTADTKHKWKPRRPVGEGSVTLFEQASDAAEKQDLSAQSTRLTTKLRAQLDAALGKAPAVAPGRVQFSDSVRARLKALGYAE